MSIPTPKCKKGDLAFITKSIRISNIGLIVSVEDYIGYFQRGEVYSYGGLPLVAYDAGHVWKITSGGKSIETIDGKSYFALTLDQWLTPINGFPEESDNVYEESPIEDEETV